MNDESFAATAHAMQQWLIYGLLKALCKKIPALPRGITEALADIRDEGMESHSKRGLDLAREWVWKEFTERAPPQ